MTAALVEVRDVSKSFGGVRALREVSLSIAPGEVHALCGENGAGKSTLIKVLSGVYAPDRGHVLMAGQLLLGSVRDREDAGIAVIHQESVAFPHLSAEDNIFVGREPTRLGGLWLDRGSIRRQTLALFDRLSERIDPRRPVGELPVAQRQMVSIARALSRQCRVLIMDEPTASLSGRETQVLFGIIRQLRSEGVSVLYVSHRLEEIFELADTVTVLRDGELAGTRGVGEVDRAGLIGLMVGRQVEESPAARVTAEPGEVMLRVSGLTRAGAFEDVSFDVRAGEVVAVAGLVGAGRSELARAIFGVDEYDGGTVELAGGKLPGGSPRAAIRRGLALVPEDRQHEGLVLPMSVGANLTLAVLRSLTRLGLRWPWAERPVILRQMGDLGIRAAGAGAAVETLSGGNQQKVVLGKWLATRPRVLILDEPTRGVDVGAKAEVHRLIRRLADDGMATLMISSELGEVLGMGDRVLVMRDGRIPGRLSRAEATQEKVLALALPGEGRR